MSARTMRTSEVPFVVPHLCRDSQALTYRPRRILLRAVAEAPRGMNGLTYQAASPDEAALVEAAQKLGFEFFVRDSSFKADR